MALAALGHRPEQAVPQPAPRCLPFPQGPRGPCQAAVGEGFTEQPVLCEIKIRSRGPCLPEDKEIIVITGNKALIKADTSLCLQCLKVLTEALQGHVSQLLLLASRTESNIYLEERSGFTCTGVPWGALC